MFGYFRVIAHGLYLVVKGGNVAIGIHRPVSYQVLYHKRSAIFGGIARTLLGTAHLPVAPMSKDAQKVIHKLLGRSAALT